jgi:hypothetical protein
VALLAARAAAQGAGLDLDGDTLPPAVSVCRRLDGMPLAIELAAARLRSMPLADLAARLDQRFLLLTGGSRTALARQQTLHATVTWSYSLLTAAEQALLGRLSVFAGGFDLAAAEAVGACGPAATDVAAVARLLGSLVDKSLVIAEPAGPVLRYRLLETIRLFAAERLAEAPAELAAAAAAHSAYYLAVAETATPHLYGREQGAWYDRLDADVANLRRAAEHAAAQPSGTVQVLRFSVALGRYLGVRPGSQELWAGLPLIAALERPGAPADPALYAKALLVASSQWGFGDLTAAIEFAEQAAGIAAGIGDDRLLTLSQAWLSQHYYHVGEPERAPALAQAAVGRARTLGDDALLGMSLFMCGRAAGAQASGPLYAEAIACKERCGDLLLNRDAHMFASGAALETGTSPVPGTI